MWDASLSFPLGPPVCVSYTALRASGACPLQGYWLLSLFTWHILTSIFFVRGTGRNWTAGLVTTGCLVVSLRLWQPWYTLSTSLNYIHVALNWTNVAWYSFFVTIVVKDKFRYFAGLQQLWPLAQSTNYATTHNTKRLLGRETRSLFQHWV